MYNTITNINGHMEHLEQKANGTAVLQDWSVVPVDLLADWLQTNELIPLCSVEI